MESPKNKIRTCLWFDGQAEEAAEFYTSVFSNSKITSKSRFQEAGKEYHGREPGSIMSVMFELDGHPFVGLNGGPLFKFSPATSFQVTCKDQTEVDHFWVKLGEGGDESKQRCGWLQDKFGVSWQVNPSEMLQMMQDDDKKKVASLTNAMMKMKKLDIKELKAAFDAGS